MTGKERFTKILHHEKTDRIGLYEHFWSDTYASWEQQGHVTAGECLEDRFGYDIQTCWPLNVTADLDFVPVVIAEDENTRTTLNGNYATLKWRKDHNSTPEHVDFLVKDREMWEKKIKPLLKPEPRRINFEEYRRAKAQADKAGRFFLWSGVNVFECMHPVCGHEYMLMGMIDDPEWIQDMATTYAELTIELQEMLFQQEGYPDGIWYYEDMGYKGSPFMSPRHYKELIQPAHIRTIGYAHEHKLPVVMHSCGFVEPLLPGMIEAGIDCLQAIEVKAGMDLVKLNQMYGDKIAFMGGIDVRTLYSNDFDVIDRELESKLPEMMKTHNFVLHSDHSIPNTVNFDTYLHFIQKGLELGTYKD